MIKFKNKDVQSVSNFLLNEVSLKGKKNIHRMRVVKELETHAKRFSDEELELLKEYAKTDDNDEFIRNEQGNLDIDDVKGFKEQQKELMNEEVTIEGANLESALNTVKDIVMDYNKELSGDNAEAHFLLVDAFEQVDEKGNDK
ncbi:MAG TPA: hypothetical protein VK107_03960 [Alloiococcus sp.]|nr:hypothetical protein [Alloiococcus sp.]